MEIWIGLQLIERPLEFSELGSSDRKPISLYLASIVCCLPLVQRKHYDLPGWGLSNDSPTGRYYLAPSTGPSINGKFWIGPVLPINLKACGSRWGTRLTDTPADCIAASTVWIEPRRGFTRVIIAEVGSAMHTAVLFLLNLTVLTTSTIQQITGKIPNRSTFR